LIGNTEKYERKREGTCYNKCAVNITVLIFLIQNILNCYFMENIGGWVGGNEFGVLTLSISLP